MIVIIIYKYDCVGTNIMNNSELSLSKGGNTFIKRSTVY